MRPISQRRRTARRENGSFWLSFSDMMSVLVLVFIFVIFSMMLSLNRQKDQLEKTEEQYAEAMRRMEISEQELSQKELLLADSEAQLQVLTAELEGKTIILAEKESELAEQAELIASQKADIESTILILNGEKEDLDAQLRDAEEKLTALSNVEQELDENRVQIVDLTRQLTEAQNAISVLQGNYEDEQNRVILLGKENAALLADADAAKSELEQVQKLNSQLSQRISMLNGNADAKQEEIDRLLKLIEDREKELEQLGVDYRALLAASQETENALTAAESAIRAQSEQLSSQSGKLSEYETALAGYRDELLRTQGQLEQMVGVKAQIVQKLSTALKQNSIDVSVDERTGAIRLPSEMLFGKNSTTLSAEGQVYLDRFLPVYMNVLLSGEFQPYIAEIIIEGHTDSSGTYLHNLQLSQQRAYSVANYVLDDHYMRNTMRLSGDDSERLRSLITASGRSFSAPIYGEDGQEDEDASRRVEIKFRLKDDDTIALTEALLELIGND